MSEKYVSSKDKYENFKSSSMSLLLVGFVGAIFILCVLFDVINLGINNKAKSIGCYVLLALFLFFIIAGIKAFLDSRKIKMSMVNEEDVKLDIAEYITEKIDIKDIDKTLEIDQDTSDEELYLLRTDEITKRIKEQFPDVHDSFIDEVIEEIYDKII